MGSYIQKIHDYSWREVKTDYSFYQNEGRFDILKDILNSKTPITILDVGCGSGYLAHLIKKKNPKFSVHGFDVSTEALKHYTMAEKFLLQGYYGKSIPFYEKAVAVDSGFAKAYNNLAMSCFNLDYKTEA